MLNLAQALPFTNNGKRLWAKLRAHRVRVEAAHANQARFVCLPEEASRDTGCSPEELFSAAAFDPALPFFFQAGFGER